MPGRVASGTARTSRRTISSKASAKSIRNSVETVEIPDEGEETSLRRAVKSVFADAQKSTAAHRKAIISLRKVQEACYYEPVNQKRGKQTEDFDEEDFAREFIRCVYRVMPVNKAEAAGDRIVRFIGSFLNDAARKDLEIAQEGDPDETNLPETPTSRLTTELFTRLLPVLKAKDKVVRFRATQLVSHVVQSLDTLDDTMFHQLRFELLSMVHDKEAPVRLQAVYGLGRLAADIDEEEQDEDSDSDNDAGKGVLLKLLGVLQHDPSAEVRRNLLLNLPLTKEVLPYLLERARDADATTRKALYGRLLPALGDFRHLSLQHREKLLRWGLRDRDENVRKATAKLFCERWIEDCAALPAAQAAEQEDGEVQKDAFKAAVPSLDALLELLERIDVVNSGEEGGIALVAMSEFWQSRPDYLEYVSFPDSFWEGLSPELAFVARTFNEYCRSAHNTTYSLSELAEEKLPEVTKFGFLLEREIQKLIATTIAVATEEDPENEEELAHSEFIVEQMLQMARTFDYSDEVGRQKMSRLMRNSLAMPDLPEEVSKLSVEVLRLVCGEDAKGERDFCSVVLEAIAEVHDTIMGDEDDEPDSTEDSFHSATSQTLQGEDDDATVEPQRKSRKQKAEEEADPAAAEDKIVREIMVNMKCLHIAQCMLQNVEGVLEDNVHLVMMLNNLVVPAVRSNEQMLRERGLLCLGLCCLLGKNTAQENMNLFLHCFSKGSSALKATCLQIMTDILLTHQSLLAPSIIEGEEQPSEFLAPTLKALKSSLKSEDTDVQATGAGAVSKLMLHRLITDADLLKQLVVTYFDPDTASNAQLRQSLSYFFPVYCHSHAENALRMADMITVVIAKLRTLREAYEDDDTEDLSTAMANGMVSMTQITTMLIDWTDPRRIVGFSVAVGDTAAKHGAGETHFVVAENVLERLVTSQLSKDERKTLLSMLGKLHLPVGGCEAERLKSVLELSAEAIESEVATDVAGRNSLSKLQAVLLKIMHDVATEERGGGDTVLEEDQEEEELTVVEQATVVADEEEDGEQDEAVTQIQKEMRDATLGGTTGFGFTTGLPDAEGTRIQFDEEDSV